MLICAVDTETTGLDPKKEWVIEIGGVLLDGTTWDVKSKFNILINRPEVFPLKCIDIHGITEAQLIKEGIGAAQAFNSFFNFSQDAEAFIAHNAKFDMDMIFENLLRTPGVEQPEKRPWLCSKSHVRTHHDRRCTKLSHLAVDYGCLVDGSRLHRALDDVLLMADMLKKTGQTIHDIIAFAQEKWCYFEALVEAPWKDNGRSVALAKAESFVWEGYYDDGPKFPKKWVKRVKESEFAKERSKNFGFKRLTLSIP